MANFSWALQFPNRLDCRSVSGLEAELGDMKVSVIDVYHVSDVPDSIPNEEETGSYIYVAGGVESVFYGIPPAELDFEERLRVVFRDAIISKGINHKTGETLWNARSYYFFPETDKELRKGMDAAALAAIAALDMHRMGAKNTGRQFSAETPEKKPGLRALLSEARDYGMQSRIFCNGSGVPYVSDRPQPHGFRVRLAEGTEVLAESDSMPPKIKRLKNKYKGMTVNPAFPFRMLGA